MIHQVREGESDLRAKKNIIYFGGKKRVPVTSYLNTIVPFVYRKDQNESKSGRRVFSSHYDDLLTKRNRYNRIKEKTSRIKIYSEKVISMTKKKKEKYRRR